MGTDKKTRDKKRVAVEVPTVKVKAPVRKSAGKEKIKGKKQAKRQARLTRARGLDTPPATMAPPDIRDTRPPARSQAVAEERERVHVDGPRSVPPGGGSIAMFYPGTGPLVQGSSCIWVGHMSQTATELSTERPVCPHCGGGLITAADEDTVRLGYEAFELGAYSSVNPPPRPHPGYMAFTAWMSGQGRCWPAIEQAAKDYERETGRHVDPSR